MNIDSSLEETLPSQNNINALKKVDISYINPVIE